MASPAGKLLLAGVTVVDTHDGRLSPPMDVLTDAGRIVSLIPSRKGRLRAAGTRVVQARGKFLVPGFNDLHAHALNLGDPSGDLALLFASGITGFRQMAGTPQMLQARHDHTLPIGPYAPEPLIIPGEPLTPLNAGTPEQAAAEVRKQKAQGTDFIKVVLAPPPTFFAALSEAKRLGLPSAGHLQSGVDAAEASKAGLTAIEHLGPGDTLLVSCSSEEAALRAEIAKRPPPPALPPGATSPAMAKMIAQIIAKTIINPSANQDPVDVARLERISETFDEKKCRALADVFKANRTWQVPTLIREKTSELADLPEFANDPNLRYMPPDVVQSWREATARYSARQTAASRQAFRAGYALLLRVTKLFDDAGVPMMAGSDESGAGWVVPGFSLHQEFDELAAAGVSPLHILQMTTLNGAVFLGRTATMGSVEPGKTADLVLLDANPLVDVRNLHKIYAVVRAGRYYSRSDLDEVLARVESGKGYLH